MTSENDLNEARLTEIMVALRTNDGLAAKPAFLQVTEEGIAQAQAMAAADPELKRRMLEQFPQMKAILP